MKDTFRTVLVDDETNNLKVLRHFLKMYCPSINVIASCDSYDSALKTIQEESPDVVFLDIVLDRDTSFDLLDELGEHPFQIIFSTAYDEYAIQAFKYSAVDYILKPLVIENVIAAVQRVEERIRNNEIVEMKQIKHISRSLKTNHPSNYITISGANRVDFINPIDIVYLKSSERYTEFYVSKRKLKIVSSKSIGQYEENLDKTSYYRIHNSFVINLTHLVNINKNDGNYCEMSNGDKLPISRRRYEGLLRMMKSL